jgi:hypothetical protein
MQQVPVGARRVVVSAVVHRACRACGAANPQGFDRCPACDQPATSEDLGAVAYWHRNPLKRWWWKARRLTKRQEGRSA